MSEIDDEVSAFPSRRDRPYRGGGSYRDDRPGMTLRDYFAAKAMQGWLSSYGPDDTHPAKDGNDADVVAQRSYAIADAMLAARGAQ